MNDVQQKDSNRIKYGVFWSAIERFSSQGIQFVVSVVLARFLMPEDYGIIAMAMVIVAVLQGINEAEFGVALMHKLDRDDLDISTVYVFNIVFGLFLYAVVFFTAPVISDFFHEPSLTLVNRLLALSLIINSFAVVQRTLLLIKIDFKKMSTASIIAAIVSGVVAIFMANYNYGEMALIAQYLIFSAVDALVIFLLVKSYPAFKFSFSRFKPIFNYTYKLLGARLLNVIFSQGYPLIIGKYYSAGQLGYFNRALSFQSISSNNIAQIIQRVSTPLLCEVQHDKEELSRVLIKFLRIALGIVCPLVFGIYILAEPLIIVVLTEKWIYSAKILKILCPVSILYVFNTFNKNIFNATGRTDWAFKSELIKKIIFIPIIISGIFLNFESLIFGLVLIEFTDFLISTYYTKKQIGLSIFQQIKSVSDIFGVTVIMSLAVIGSVMHIENNFLKLLIGFASGIVTYVLLILCFNLFNSKNMMKKNFEKLFVMLRKDKY